MEKTYMDHQSKFGGQQSIVLKKLIHLFSNELIKSDSKDSFF